MQRARQDSLGGSRCQTQAFVVRLGTLQPLYDLDLFFGVAQLGGEGSFLSTVLHRRHHPFKQGLKQHRQCSSPLLACLQTRISNADSILHHRLRTFKQGLQQQHLSQNKVCNNNICHRTRSATTTFITEQGLQQQHSSQNKVCNNNIRHRTRSATTAFLTEQGLQQQHSSQNKVCNTKDNTLHLSY